MRHAELCTEADSAEQLFGLTAEAEGMTSSPIPKNPQRALNPAPPLSVENPGDALALVQHTFGYLPENSLVLIGLMDGRTGGHLRVNLASGEDRSCELGLQCAAWLAGPDAFPIPEAVLAVIFDSEIPHPDTPDRHDLLLAALAQGLAEEADVALIKVWHCGAGRIRDYECHDADCCPYPGEQAEHVMAGTLQRVPALVGTRAFSPQESVQAFLSCSPLITEEEIRAVREDHALTPQCLEEVMTVWETALSDGVRELPPGRTAVLLRTLEDPANVGLLMAVTTAGVSAVDTAAEELVDRVWGSSEIPPQWARVDALDSLLHQLVPFAEEEQLEEILGLKSWIEWIRGRGSHAAAVAEQVQRLVPERWECSHNPPLARFVLHRVTVQGVCPWAQVKQSSYSWWSTQAAQNSLN